MLSCTGKRSHRHTILHVSFSNSFGLASARPTPQGLSGAPITLDELKEVPLVLRERGSGTLDVLITALHKHNIKLSDLTIRMHLGSTESIKLFLENSECMGILSIRSINKELYSGKFKVLDIKDLVMFREFDFVQLQGQDTGLPALFMQFANHYKEKL